MSDFLPWLGWALVPAFAALYWGERARRIDAQKREERLPVIEPDSVAPAQVRLEAPATPRAEEFDAGRESYVQACIREGYTRDEAEADWQAMIERQHSDARVS